MKSKSTLRVFSPASIYSLLVLISLLNKTADCWAHNALTLKAKDVSNQFKPRWGMVGRKVFETKLYFWMSLNFTDGVISDCSKCLRRALPLLWWQEVSRRKSGLDRLSATSDDRLWWVACKEQVCLLGITVYQNTSIFRHCLVVPSVLEKTWGRASVSGCSVHNSLTLEAKDVNN